jgi:4-amino-4-deoxy-L-arabinose transferase-like glycosyltransferase
LLGLLIAFHLVNNWLWRDSNVIVFSMDRMFHQVTSLAYDDILREGVSLHTLFSALTWSDYYPPLVHLTVAAFYGIFGVSMDVAAMANSLYLVVLLLAVYSLGERLAGPWVGLLSAFVVSTFPIVFSMSRYLYIDFALTAMVAVNICLLVRSEGFQHKAYTLLYGLSLGLGMLTKWTFIAFAAAPFLLVLFTSGAIPDAVRALRPTASSGACPACPEGTRGKRSDRKRLLAACLLGLGLTALWFVPNAEATAALPLGYALPILSWLLWSATWYFALAPSGRGSNLLAALGLGLSIASSWYLTKINALDAIWLNAYGKPTGRSWGFLPYLEFLYREQLSPIYAVLALVAIVGLIWLRWRRTRNLREMLALGTAGWVLVLWTLASFLIFSSQASIIHSRYIMPLLPPLGIAIALWLYRIRQHWIRALLIALVVALALVQFAALTFDALGNLQEDIPVFAKGLSIQLPASGRTDAGYWVAPEILAYIEEHSDTACPEQSDRACPEQSDRDPAQFGILVNTNQVNSKQFIYLVYSDYPHVRIAELATVGRALPSYPRLFENDFILAAALAPRGGRGTVALLRSAHGRPGEGRPAGGRRGGDARRAGVLPGPVWRRFAAHLSAAGRNAPAG